jgi:cytochrome P450
MAGTESTAKSMTIAAFYLLHQPSIMTRLRQELAEARTISKADQVPVSVLLSLPYLNGIIQESHRLSFGVTRRLARYSPTETLTYTATSGPHKGVAYTLPPGTRMSSSTLCIHTDESLFPDPWTFDPERWIASDASDANKGDTSRSAEAVNRRKRSLLALGKGHRKCIGINLANAEICLALTVFAGYGMRLFETDESDVKFQHDYQISHPNMGSKGVRVLVEGRVEG